MHAATPPTQGQCLFVTRPFLPAQAKMLAGDLLPRTVAINRECAARLDRRAASRHHRARDELVSMAGLLDCLRESLVAQGIS